MSHDSSRKRFLARILGLAAVGAVAPGTLARAALQGPKAGAQGGPASFRLTPQARAVARRQGSA